MHLHKQTKIRECYSVYIYCSVLQIKQDFEISISTAVIYATDLILGIDISAEVEQH